MKAPHKFLPKLFGELRERYLTRPGGYTRVLRIEPEKEDQAPSAILELVDGTRDMRFTMTAKTLARERAAGTKIRDLTASNVEKVTKFRPNGRRELERLVGKLEQREGEVDQERRMFGGEKKKVYHPREPPGFKGFL